MSRLSPLVNEVVIGLPDKDRFNASEPKDDGSSRLRDEPDAAGAARDAVRRRVNATLGTSVTNIAPSNLPRTDLVTAFLTGFRREPAEDGDAVRDDAAQHRDRGDAGGQQSTFGVAAATSRASRTAAVPAMTSSTSRCAS